MGQKESKFSWFLVMRPNARGLLSTKVADEAQRVLHFCAPPQPLSRSRVGMECGCGETAVMEVPSLRAPPYPGDTSP